MKHKKIGTISKEETLKERNLKPVKIDDKTTILVPFEKDEKEARDEFLLKLGERERNRDNYNKFEP